MVGTMRVGDIFVCHKCERKFKIGVRCLLQVDSVPTDSMFFDIIVLKTIISRDETSKITTCIILSKKEEDEGNYLIEPTVEELLEI